MGIVVQMRTLKAKLSKERIVIVPGGGGADDKQSTSTEILLHARVLGKGKGTPMLKNGVKCLEKFPDPDETDANTDWQGFDDA